MGRLDRLILVDFKSYQGEQVIGPFLNFTAIVGPNGAGKSNLMDAISFVLGLDARKLRGSALRDLIYTSSRPEWVPPKRASVTLVYVPDEGEMADVAGGTEVEFTRIVHASSGTASYRLLGAEVSAKVYQETLESLGILIKARNFLIFQVRTALVSWHEPTRPKRARGPI